ncbi:hypothetical protein [Psychrobacter phenylpyruvicus]|uniref:Uncharacterized protein n=1 Tax=Psychrobacter phenylpyruvicus TaxID=29432 RepID=A0A379LJ32_9GAMM|nr:hypothetical protein [Psychrobacter phenylpyruvicus]SUD90620.1 Uncharacterised protein [Psychrobacter phenylpyruvicus]
MTFYLKDTDKEYFGKFWALQRKFLEDEGGRLLSIDEANTHPFDNLIEKGSKGITGASAMKPRLTQDYHYFCIPYELDDEVEGGIETDVIIKDLINTNLEAPIFIASTDPRLGCFGECSHIDEDLIWNFSSPHLNTPFIIFDNKKEVFALIDYDLPLQIIGYKNSISDTNNYIKNKVGQSGWNNVFERYSHYTNMPYIFKEYYGFLLPKLIKQQLNISVN